jgi:hypothetical protein
VFWQTRGHVSEGRQRFAAALSRPGAAAPAPEQPPTKARADALNGAGNLAAFQGDFASARSLFEESLAIHSELGDKRGSALSLMNLGIVASDQGDYSWARSGEGSHKKQSEQGGWQPFLDPAGSLRLVVLRGARAVIPPRRAPRARER